MNASYSKHLQDILKKSYPDLEKEYEITFKKSFGAVAGYVDSNIFCSCGKFGFALKLPSKKIQESLEEGGEPLQYFPKGHVKKEYVVLPKTIMQNKNRLKEFIAASLQFVTRHPNHKD